MSLIVDTNFTKQASEHFYYRRRNFVIGLNANKSSTCYRRDDFENTYKWVQIPMECEETLLWVPGISLPQQRQFWQVVAVQAPPYSTGYLHIYMAREVQNFQKIGRIGVGPPDTGLCIEESQKSRLDNSWCPMHLYLQEGQTDCPGKPKSSVALWNALQRDGTSWKE